MDNWNKLANKVTVDKVIDALAKRNIESFYVDTGNDAKKKVFELLPKGSRVLTSTSITLETIGLHDEVEESTEIKSVRKEYMALDHEKDAAKIRELRSTPEIVIGSVHAVTHDGQVLIASNTGSQIAPYSYSAKKVIWVVGTQKIVKDLDEGMKRLNEYVVPLEEKHMQSLYGVGTNISKLLIFNKEVAKDRVTLIFVNEALGF
jgi:L-lactate utilization protein LutC